VSGSADIEPSRNMPGTDSVLRDSTTRVQANESGYIITQRFGKHPTDAGCVVTLKRRVYAVKRSVDSNSSFGL
jgi:hypothetical protein